MVAALADERYISLTTFKRDGSPVSTPVWVTSDDGRRLLVWSGARTWKVRRVLVTPASSSLRPASAAWSEARGSPGERASWPTPASTGSCAGSTGC